MVNFRDMSQGLHTFTIVAEDKDGLVDKCEVHFEGIDVHQVIWAQPS